MGKSLVPPDFPFLMRTHIHVNLTLLVFVDSCVKPWTLRSSKIKTRGILNISGRLSDLQEIPITNLNNNYKKKKKKA